MGNVVQVDGCLQFSREHKFLRRRIIAGEHDVIAPDVQSVAKHQLRIAGTVHPAPFGMQKFHDLRIRKGFDSEEFLVSLVPGKRALQPLQIEADGVAVIDIKGSRKRFCGFRSKFFCKRNCFHLYPSFILLSISRSASRSAMLCRLS